MRQNCIEAVVNALGRPMKAGEAADIEERIMTQQRLLARRDPQAWHAMSTADRLTMAAKAAADDLVAQAKLAERRASLQVLAQARTMNYVATSGFSPFEALQRKLAYFADGKSNTLSVESAAKSIKSIAWSQMLDVIDATKGKYLGLLSDTAQIRDLVRELHGEATGNPVAHAAAKAFHAVAEPLRNRFNAAGGNIGHLEKWAVPQMHAVARVAKAGVNAWVDFVMPRLDRRQYYNEDGTTMSNAQLEGFLREAYKTISTDGANKLVPGQAFGKGAKANNGSAHRSIHFKDADAWLEYQSQFGDKSLLQIMEGHIAGMSRDIALIEELGPNPSHTMNYLIDHYKQELANNDVPVKDLEKPIYRLRNIYAEVAGAHEPPVRERLAAAFDTYRSLNVASRLGSAVVTSLADQGALITGAGIQHLPVWKVLRHELSLLNPANAADREVARRAGLGLEQMMGSLNRFSSDGLGTASETAFKAARWSSAVANKVMQVSGMNALTAAAQQGYGMVMFDTIGGMTRKAGKLADLDPADTAFFRRAGVTETEWSVWQLADVDAFRGSDTVLTPRAILQIPDSKLTSLAASSGMTPQALREAAATRLMGAVQDEVSVGVTEPGVRERTFMYGDSRRGTAGGELHRQFWQFKSFAVALIMRHYARMMAQETSYGKAAYGAALMTTTTMLGALTIQISELSSGRDPRDMTDPRFWLAALLKGGSLGLFGDFLFADTTQHGNTLLGALGGPMVGDLEALWGMTKGNIDKVAAGKESDFGADAVRFIKGKTPGANIWYTKAVTDHLIFHNIQEQFSPGYLRRMQNRSRKEFGQEWWWTPGEATPDRSPDWERAAGGS